MFSFAINMKLNFKKHKPNVKAYSEGRFNITVRSEAAVRCAYTAHWTQRGRGSPGGHLSERCSGHVAHGTPAHVVAALFLPISVLLQPVLGVMV